ncbi:flagellin synthesis regulatory protein [Bacillus sp. TS-2]|nr:flagellin synthesis regulatory protein [Bacillus sp. TS-2]
MEINPYHRMSNHPYQQKQLKIEHLQSKHKKRDQLEISSEALEMQKANPLVEARQKKVEELRKQVESGEYKVQPEKVAQAFYDYWNENY